MPENAIPKRGLKGFDIRPKLGDMEETAKAATHWILVMGSEEAT